jgi:ferredoxin
MKVSIDHEVCTGHGRCYTLAPDVFDSDDSGYGEVKTPDVPVDLMDQARAGERNCPEHAVRVEED